MVSFKQKNAWVVGVLAVILIGGVILGLPLFLNYEIKKNATTLTHRIQEVSEFPITFQSIHAKWVGLSLGIALTKVTVADTKTPIPFASLDDIELSLHLKKLIWDKTLVFKGMTLKGLKIRVGLDENASVSLLGLNGESLAAQFEPERLTRFIQDHPKCILKDALIEWQKGGTLLRHSLSGKLKRSTNPNEEWIFEGKQSLQLPEGSLRVPSKLKISAAPLFHSLLIQIQDKNIKAECTLQNQTPLMPLRCHMESTDISIETVQSWIKPFTQTSEVLHWLHAAVKKGRVDHLSLQLKGPLSALEWEGEAGFVGVDCQFDPDWPRLEKTKGLIKVENEGITLSLLQGSIWGAPIESSTFIIKPEGKMQTPTISFEGTLNNTVEKGLAFLQRTPLKQAIASKLEVLNPKGLMDLTLALKIPLAPSIPIQVEGRLYVRQGELSVPDGDLSLSNVEGAFYFSEKALKAPSVKAYAEALPLSLSLSTHHDQLQIEAKGTAGVDFLKRYGDLSLLQQCRGEAPFLLTYTRPMASDTVEQEAWSFYSTLKGLEIQRSDFLGKPLQSERPLRVTVLKQPTHQTKILLQFDKTLDLKVLTEGKWPQWHLIKGHIVFGGAEASWQPQNALLLQGTFNQVELDEWIDLAKEKGSLFTSLPPKVSVEGWIKHLTLKGQELKNVHLKGGFEKTKGSDWAVDSPSLKGRIEVLPDFQRVNIALDRLTLHSTLQPSSSAFDWLQKTKPALSFECRELRTLHSHWGQVQVELLPSPYGYSIQAFKIESRQSELQGQGEWYLENTSARTHIHGDVVSLNVGALLSDWGQKTAIRESSGRVEYDLAWKGHPFAFDVNQLEGRTELKLDKGRILGVEPGLGRVLGLLNLDSIQRRIQLDFSDLFKQGFVFDKMRGQFKFQKGQVQTEKLLIDGPSAKIELKGLAELSTKNLNVRMEVEPHVGLGLPIAAAIAAGNPAVGAGVWLFGKLTGSKMKKASKHFYQIRGTWESPLIQESTLKDAGASL